MGFYIGDWSGIYILDIPEIDNRDQIIKKLRNARETDSILQIKIIIFTCINYLPIEPELQNKLIKMLDHMYKNHFNSHAFSTADICNLVPLLLRLYSKHEFANLRELIPGLDFRLFPFMDIPTKSHFCSEPFFIFLWNLRNFEQNLCENYRIFIMIFIICTLYDYIIIPNYKVVNYKRYIFL